MSDYEQALYEHIIQNSAEISKKWFENREFTKGSIYSTDASHQIQKTLKEQHIYTIETIASGFLEEPSIFQQNLGKWINIVVNSRVEHGTPIYEFLSALSRTRQLIWTVVEEYSLKHEHIDKQRIIKWSALYQATMDRLINEFTRRYHSATSIRILSQQQLLDEIDSPIIPVVDAVAVLPIIGFVDETRAATLLETVPEKCMKENITYLVIDVSGVNNIDTLVANQFYRLTEVLNLLGITPIVSGISPEIAITAVRLGIVFDRTKTYSNLKQALLHFGVRKI
ncbi:rsbT co-antagonist protein RsbR [Peribacillus deserti]|uniref:RsbT co-antagonist protein RsbR n=1 Tax=Peribacillus deserti TaxID=673318 RepID=A0ABS2QLR0_9BACI|nr:STAS domain-containing protein [Peribacillus deserti]MBM7693945.1 rsbT co-antagonist protein RsbR [Peribacillus deserti]